MNIDTKLVYKGDWVTASTLPDGTIIARPIYVKYWRNGAYISVDDARKLVQELNDALAHLPVGR